MQRTEAVGPKVGGELRQKALYAILISFVGDARLSRVALRVALRRRRRVATAHDILATLAFIKYTHLEISLVVVGGILTMIGYSLNDTIIIFDRVRENLRKRQKVPLYDTLNRSVNETLPRSVLTHATVFATLLALALLGGEVLRPFALVMLFGVVDGNVQLDLRRSAAPALDREASGRARQSGARRRSAPRRARSRAARHDDR